MPARLLIILIDAIFLTLLVSLFSIGHNFKKGPMRNGCRKWIIHFVYHIACSFCLIVAGMRTELRYVNFDYTYYLGPNYRVNQKKIKRTSTIVSNHVSWLDAVVLIKNVRPAFAPSEEFRNVPLLGKLIDSIDSIYIPRGGSEEKRAMALQAIGDRQKLIEETGRFAPFLIFAEGGTTNGTAILKFKKGAFFSERTVRPVLMNYQYDLFSPAFDIIEALPLVILHLSWACFKCTVNVMPDFQPNDYLFEKHKDKGEERWEIYAWAVRDAMMKAGRLQQCDIPLRQKIQYESYMQRRRDALLDDLTLLIKDVAAPDSENDMTDEEDAPIKQDLSTAYNPLRSDQPRSKTRSHRLYESSGDQELALRPSNLKNEYVSINSENPGDLQAPLLYAM